jgi:hypothetical protein
MSLNPTPSHDAKDPTAQNAGQPKDVTSERVDVNGEVLTPHHDNATNAEKAKQRKDYISDIVQFSGSFK